MATKKDVETNATAAEEVQAVAVAPAVSVEAEVKPEPKKRGRKPGSKNKNVGKKAEKKTEKKTEKKADKKETKAVKEVKTEKRATKTQAQVYIQYLGAEYDIDEIKAAVKAAYEAEGHRVSSIKSLNLYIKPEEKKAYYVINDKAVGSVEL